MSVKHLFSSPKADGGDTTLVRPSNWNADHSIQHILFDADNTYDIGASGATRPRTGYFGTAIAIGTNPAASGSIRIPNGGSVVGRKFDNLADITLFSLLSTDNVILGGIGGVNPFFAVIGGSTGFVINKNDNSANNLVLNDGGDFHLPRIGTTASAANAFIDNAATNNVLRSTSSLRYKKLVRDLGLDEARRLVLGLRPIVYRSKARADDPRAEFVGLGAEHVAELDGRLVTRDEQGRPDWVQYQAIVAPIALLVQDLERRLVAGGM